MALELRLTRVFNDTLTAWLEGKRRALHEGGTSSSKTYSILQFLAKLAEETKVPLLISVVSESLPHLKRGAITDFFSIMGEEPRNNPNYLMTEYTYQRPEWKGKIQFFGADDQGKVRGPRRDILFINEGNNVPWETARALDIRTSTFTLVDWNPVSEFWVHKYETPDGKPVLGWLHNEDSAYIHSTYLDALEAGVLPEQKARDIEEYRDKDPNWWNIYGLGLLGKVEGLVHPHFEIVDKLPAGDYFYGLDFGFSVDPAVLTKNVIIGDALYSQELIYQKGLTNDAIARQMDLCKVLKNYDEIWADAAEPKSIDEIYDRNFNIKAAEKGPGSVEYGIQKVNQYRQFWTKDSINCIKEQRNYRYIVDKNGVITKKTTHIFSHGMDSRRYGVGSYEAIMSNRVAPAVYY